jgi:hypothetical protein
MKTAPVEHSLIRESVAHRFIETVEMISWEDALDVHVPRLNDSSQYDLVPVFNSMTLTWERHGHTTTRKTEFHLVPDRMLDTDILFGEATPRKGNPGVCIPFTCDHTKCVD